MNPTGFSQKVSNSIDNFIQKYVFGKSKEEIKAYRESLLHNSYTPKDKAKNGNHESPQNRGNINPAKKLSKALPAIPTDAERAAHRFLNDPNTKIILEKYHRDTTDFQKKSLSEKIENVNSLKKHLKEALDKGTERINDIASKSSSLPAELGINELEAQSGIEELQNEVEQLQKVEDVMRGLKP